MDYIKQNATWESEINYIKEKVKYESMYTVQFGMLAVKKLYKKLYKKNLRDYVTDDQRNVTFLVYETL